MSLDPRPFPGMETPKLGVLTIDGASSTDFGIWIRGSELFNSSSPDVSVTSVPGRNGDLLYSNNRFKNYTVTIPCFMRTEFRYMFPEFRSFLFSDVGYRRLEDSYHAGMFRLGRITGTVNPATILWSDDGGQFDISFDCKPQHFLTEGEEAITISGSEVVTNPTYFAAKPLLKVIGYGTIYIGDETIEIEENTLPYMMIDCEIMDCYYGQVTNANGLVTVSGDEFPKLPAGDTEISYEGSITSLEVTPRWYTI